jgi:hypothetical protein
MPIKKSTFQTKCLMMSLVITASVSAQAQSYKIDVDKGEVVVDVIKDQAKAIAHTIKVPTECPRTKVKLKESKASLKFSHSGEKCEKGATITINLNPSVTQLKLNLKSGVLDVSSQLRESSQKIDAKVNAGLIMSSVLTKKRTSNQAGEVGSYQSKESANKRTLDIVVESGVINVK